MYFKDFLECFNGECKVHVHYSERNSENTYVIMFTNSFCIKKLFVDGVTDCCVDKDIDLATYYDYRVVSVDMKDCIVVIRNNL